MPNTPTRQRLWLAGIALGVIVLLAASTAIDLGGNQVQGILSALHLPVGVPVLPITKAVMVGDSLTEGDTLVGIRSSWPYLVAEHLGIPPINLGVSGITSQGLDPMMFTTSFPQDSHGAIFYPIGTNDVNVGGNDANQAANFGQDVGAQYAEISIPTAVWTKATSFTYTGAHSAGYFPWSVKMTGAGTAIFTATGSTIYLITVMQPTGTGAATLVCDGSTIPQAGLSTMYFGGVGGSAPYLTQQSLTRFTGLSNTTHTCSVTYTSGTVELVQEVGLSGSAHPTWPLVWLGNIPPRNPDTSAPYESMYRNAQNAMAATLIADGLSNVTMIDMNDGTFSNTLLYNDGLHFTTFGFWLYAQKFINSIDAKYPNAGLIQLPFAGDILTNNAKYGQGNMDIGWKARTSPDWLGNYNTRLGTFGCSNLLTGNAVTCIGNAAGAHDVGSSNMGFFGAGADQCPNTLLVDSVAIGAFAVVCASHRIVLGSPDIIDAFLGNGQGISTDNNAPIIVGPAGNRYFGNPHILIGTAVLTAGTATVTLQAASPSTGLAGSAFPGGSYYCDARDSTTPATPVVWANIASNSPTTLVFTGATGDSIKYRCEGN